MANRQYQIAFRLGARVNSSFNNAFGRAQRNLNSLTRTVKTAVAAFISIGAAKSIFSSTIGNAAELEGYRNTLNVVMKDQAKAAKTMAWAVKFANKTPFETNSIVEATVKLQSYGLEAKKVMPMIGDMAGVMNKDIIQAVEAVADAQTGEVERLKEFGITKEMIIEHANKKLRMQNIINNKGQIVDQENFNKALFSLMKERFKGGMGIQANSFKGLWSTIQGVWKTGMASIAGISATGEIVKGGLFDSVKKRAKGLVDTLTKLSENGSFEKIGTYIGEGLTFASKSFSFIKKNIDIILPTVSGLVTAFYAYKAIMLATEVPVMIMAARQWALNTAMTANPIGIVVAALAGLGAALVIAYKKSDSFRAIVDKSFGQIIEPAKLFFNIFTGKEIDFSKIIEQFSKLGFSTEQTTSMIEKFKTLSDVIKKAAKQIGSFLSNLAEKGFKNFLSTLKIIFTTLKPFFLNFVNILVNDVFPILADTFEWFQNTILPIFVAIWNNAWPRLSNIVRNVFSAIAGFYRNILLPIFKLLIDIFSFAWPYIKGIVEAAVNNIKNILSGLIQVFDGIIAFVSGVFTGNWTQAWQGIKDIFGGIFSSLAGVVKSPLNVVIGLINGAIESINTVSFDVPEWVPRAVGGGKSFGVNIPKIPMLAKGGYIKHRPGGVIANIGEGRHDEIVAPLPDLRSLLDIPISTKSTTNKESIQITYSPQIIIQGNADEKTINKAVKTGSDDFEKRFNKLMANRNRLALNRG